MSITTSHSQIKFILDLTKKLRKNIIIIMVDMKEQMSLEDYKKESMRLMNTYEKELNEFCSEKLNTSIAGTLILQGY